MTASWSFVKDSYEPPIDCLIPDHGTTATVTVWIGVVPANRGIPLHEQPRSGTLTPDRGSCAPPRTLPYDPGGPYRTAKPYTVSERNVPPGRRTVLGKSGRFGESGKCCVSSAMPAPGAKGSPMWSAV